MDVLICNSAHFLKGLNYYMTILCKPTSLEFQIQEIYRKTKKYEKLVTQTIWKCFSVWEFKMNSKKAQNTINHPIRIKKFLN